MRRRAPTTVMAFVLAIALLAGACATLAPGEDPIVVRTQQTLAIGQDVYDWGMSWCTANAGKFSPAGLALVNDARVKFPPAYRTLDTALDGYKAGKTADLQGALEAFNSVVTQVQVLVLNAGGPDLKADATAKEGGTP
jgi:hypothetical protein